MGDRKALYLIVRGALIEVLRGLEEYGLAEGWIKERALPSRQERREIKY